MSDMLRVCLEEPIARITLSRPPLNVLTIAMMREMAQSVTDAGKAPGVRLLRLDAQGKAFCAGVDVGEHMGEALPRMMEALAVLFRALDETPVPTVSVVQGAALGGGCEVVLGTDLCLASEAASFGLPEIKLGVFAPPASVLLPRLIGERRALEMLLTGEAIRASEAERFGLVNRVFPADDFDAAVDGWFARALKLSGTALRLTKRAVRAARVGSFEQAHASVARLYLDDLMQTQDAREGLQAFLDKRPPTWTHR